MKKVGSYALLISMLSGCSQQNTVNQTESEVSEAQMQENSENIETEKMQDTEKILHIRTENTQYSNYTPPLCHRNGDFCMAQSFHCILLHFA